MSNCHNFIMPSMKCMILVHELNSTYKRQIPFYFRGRCSWIGWLSHDGWMSFGGFGYSADICMKGSRYTIRVRYSYHDLKKLLLSCKLYIVFGNLGFPTDIGGIISMYLFDDD